MATLQIAFVTMASGLILLWLVLALMGPRKVETPEVVVLLRYGSALRVFALVLAWMPPAVAIYVLWNFTWRNERTLALAGVSFLAASVIAGLLLIEVERVQIALSEIGIARTSPWTGRCTLTWDEVERIDYSPLNRWWVVQGAGKKIRVSAHLAGVGAFVEMVRRKVPAEKIPHLK